MLDADRIQKVKQLPRFKQLKKNLLVEDAAIPARLCEAVAQRDLRWEDENLPVIMLHG